MDRKNRAESPLLRTTRVSIWCAQDLYSGPIRVLYHLLQIQIIGSKADINSKAGIPNNYNQNMNSENMQPEHY